MNSEIASFLNSSGYPQQVGPSNPLPVTQSVAGAAVSPTNPVPIIDGYAAVQTAVWTPATAANAALTSSTAGMDTVIVTANVTAGTVTGGTIYFEVWDGAAWLPTKVPRIESYATDTVASLAGNNSISSTQQHAWQVPVAGFTQYRTRLATQITGAGSSVTVAHLVSSAPDTSLVTVGLDPSQAVVPQASAITTTTGTATTGSGGTIALAAGAVTKFLAIQNTAASGTLYVGIGQNATNAQWAIAAGQSWTPPVLPQQAIYLLGSASVGYCILSA